MRSRRRWLVALLLGALVLALAAACTGDRSAVDDPATADGTAGTGSGAPSGGSANQPPPEAAEVDAASVELIEEWAEAKVPRYPGANLSERSPEGSSMVENAGTIIVDTPDETAEVMAFYRGAMPALGWTEVRASATQAVFETDVASLTISLVRQGETTLAMLQLLDA